MIDSRVFKGEKDRIRNALRMDGYLDWILDSAEPTTPLDQIEEGVEEEERVLDKKGEEETVTIDPKKTRKRYPVMTHISKVSWNI